MRIVNEERIAKRKEELSNAEVVKKSNSFFGRKEDTTNELGEGLSSLLSDLKSGNVKRQSIRRNLHKPLESVQADQTVEASSVNKVLSKAPAGATGFRLPFINSDQIKLKSVSLACKK